MATTRVLRITEDDTLRLPAGEAATQTLVVYGGKGMGKTNLIGVLLEEFTAAGQRWSLIDPVGVSWGIQYGADGKSPGVECVILGGVHGDIPIDPTGGAVVADFVVDGVVNTVIDISRRPDGRMWSIGERIRFVRDYARRLYERQGEHRRPLMLIIDEAGRFAPQNPPKGAQDIADCLGSIQVIVEEGRNVGLGVCLVTQRSARMDKTVSELAECMIAFRTIGPRSVDAIADWLGEHVSKDRWKQAIEQIRSLPRGHALIVSPGWLEFEGVAQIRKRWTYDSSATPTAAARKLSTKDAAKPDLDRLRARLEETAKRAEENDPAKLQRELRTAREQNAKLTKQNADLESKVQAKGATAATPAPPREATLRADDRRALEGFAKRIEKAREDLLRAGKQVVEDFETWAAKALTDLAAASTRPEWKRLLDLLQAPAYPASNLAPPRAAAADRPVPAAPRSPAPPSAPRKPPSGPAAEDSRLVNSAGELKKHVRGILTALAQHPTGRTRDQVLILAGYQPSGDISTAFAGMLEHEWIEQRGSNLTIKVHGLTALGPFEPLAVGRELRDQLLSGSKLSSAERKILRAAFDLYPNPSTRAGLHERAGLRPSGDTSTAIAKFIKLGWFTEIDGGFLPAATFFEGE